LKNNVVHHPAFLGRGTKSPRPPGNFAYRSRHSQATKYISCIFEATFFINGAIKSATHRLEFSPVLTVVAGLVMVALWNRADHYIFILILSFFLPFFLFPRVISAVGDWMSTILPHMHMVWP